MQRARLGCGLFSCKGDRHRGKYLWKEIRNQVRAFTVGQRMAYYLDILLHSNSELDSVIIIPILQRYLLKLGFLVICPAVT